MCIVPVLCIVVSFKLSCVCCYLMCICCTVWALCVCVCVFYIYIYIFFLLTLNAGLLATGQYSEGPATGHLDTGFSWFPCAQKQMR